MKFISFLILLFFISSCVKKKLDPSEIYPPYRLVKTFSQKVRDEKNLILKWYGVNNSLPDNYERINGIGNFSVAYSLFRDRSDEISVDAARSLLIFIAENFLKEINSNPEIKSDLDVYPFTSRLLDISIYFKDENHIELSQSVSRVFFSHGKIEYEGYNISQYRNRPPAVGKHYTIHEESYEEALEIVKKQGSLTYLD